jgi:hypothetical protein
MRRASLPPPEAFTLKDAVQIAFGLIMIPMGAVILYDTAIRGAATLGILAGGAFIAFGLHRTVLAAARLRWYYANRRRPINNDIPLRLTRRGGQDE